MKKKQSKKGTGNTQYKSVANFLFEVGILARTPRSGFHFLHFRHQDDPDAPSALLPTNFVTCEV